MKFPPPIADELRKGRRVQGSELTRNDVGRLLSFNEGFGRVFLHDVGKRVWLKPYGLVMENDEQRDERLERDEDE